jgi:hypothetical protein
LSNTQEGAALDAYVDIFKVIAGEAVCSSQAGKFLERLVNDFPGRQCGTAEGITAGSFILDSFRTLGLNVRREPFSFPGYVQEDGRVSAGIYDERGAFRELFSCRTKTYIYSPIGHFSGPLAVSVEKELADSHQIASLNIPEGSIVLSDRMLHPKLIHRKISAFIYITPESAGGGRYTASVIDRLSENFISPLPACSVENRDGRKLAALQQRYPDQIKVKVVTGASSAGTPFEGANITAVIPGKAAGDCSSKEGTDSEEGTDSSEDTEEIIVAGSHYDSFSGVPGATDNGAGTAVLFEAARILAQLAAEKPNKRAIHFISFDGEELGLLGSSFYVKQHENELNRYRMMVNLDCTGKIGPKRLRVHAWPEIIPSISRLTDQLPLTGGAADSWYSYRSDHFPFWCQGIPTIYGYDGFQPLAGGQHTPNDTLEKVIPDGLLSDVIITASLLYLLANAEELPWNRRTPEEMTGIFKEYGILEESRRFADPV